MKPKTKSIARNKRINFEPPMILEWHRLQSVITEPIGRGGPFWDRRSQTEVYATTVLNNSLSSCYCLNKRVKGRIAKYPKRHHYYEKHPDESWVKLVALDGLVMENRNRVTYQCKKKNGQQQHHERVKLKSAEQVTVKQAVESASCATARAIESGEQAKRTIKKEPGFTRLKNEKICGACGDRQPNQPDSHTSIYYPIKVHETAKLTRYIGKEKRDEAVDVTQSVRWRIVASELLRAFQLTR